MTTTPVSNTELSRALSTSNEETRYQLLVELYYRASINNQEALLAQITTELDRMEAGDYPILGVTPTDRERG